MTKDAQTETVLPLQLTRLSSYRRGVISLWNWYSAAFPGAADWSAWLREITGQLLKRPVTSKIRIVKSNLVESGQPAEKVLFESQEFGIGRGAENSIVLPEATITRNHARLRRQAEAIVLEDLGSAMGTIHLGSKLMPGVSVELSHGDEFVIFPYRFKVEIEREWVADSGGSISEATAHSATWAQFLDDCPSGWQLAALGVEPVGISACMAAGEAFLREFSGRLLDPIAEYTVADESLIELFFLLVIERANRDLSLPFQFSLGRIGRRPRIADDASGIVAAASIDVAGVRGAVRLFLPFELLGATIERWHSVRNDGLAQHAAWQFRFSVGHVELNMREWNSIDRGDVLLYSPEPALLFPGDDRVGWQAAWDGAERVTLAGKLDRRMVMTQNPDSGPATLQELPLRVQVLIDEHELTLAQAERLAPGSVLDLDRDPRAPVRLAVNGRVVGSGELVEIEGRLGVKILNWSSQ